jgi:hypothetical protein
VLKAVWTTSVDRWYFIDVYHRSPIPVFSPHLSGQTHRFHESVKGFNIRLEHSMAGGAFVFYTYAVHLEILKW